MRGKLDYDAVMRKKKCKSCGDVFLPTRPIQPTCGELDCALAYGLAAAQKSKDKREREANKAHREAKAKAKPRVKWMQEAQAAFNRWVRLRDAHLPCISCGTTQAKWDAGHYRSAGSHPALRFEPLNTHKQCAQCNQHKSGAAIEYRAGLVARIGKEKVDWLEGPHDPKKYTIDDLRQLKADYTRMVKDLTHRVSWLE